MISLKLDVKNRPLEVLCLGAHSDDIEIGAGATVLTLAEAFDSVVFHWVVFSADLERVAEAHNGAELFAPGADVQVHGFADSRFPMQLDALKDVFVDLGRRVEPDVVFTHTGNDRHQDHATVSDLTWQTFRDHLILEYEVPKFDGDLATPSMYVNVDRRIAEDKARHLSTAFPSQAEKSWFDGDTFLAMLRIRGIECRSPSGFAEGFHVRKSIILA